MNKAQIIEELDKCIYTLDVLENVFVANKLRFIKESLTNEWDLSDFYLEQITRTIYYNENN
jgi:hypothetical protein